MAEAYLHAEVGNEQAEAELKFQQAADFAARCRTALASATKEEQLAIKKWLGNLKDASEIEDAEARAIALDHVEKAAPKVNEQFEHVQYMVKRLHLEEGLSLGDVPAKQPVVSKD